jgi:FtsZ-interacting cell division protein ZipA
MLAVLIVLGMIALLAIDAYSIWRPRRPMQ